MLSLKMDPNPLGWWQPAQDRLATGKQALLDAINLQAELLELKANPNRAGEGIVIESQLDKGRGAVATVVIQRGTLKGGDIVVAGSEWGKVRALVDDLGKQMKEAGPSAPCEVLGLSGAPQAGDRLVVVDSESRAREISEGSVHDHLQPFDIHPEKNYPSAIRGANGD